MIITTTIDGARARISPRGQLDYDTLQALRTAAAALPPGVTDVVWDMGETTFMDVTTLRLLFDPTPAVGPLLRTVVSGLGPQPMRLLALAADLDPSLDVTRLVNADSD
ncbi:STAS domain-containing protein [Streptomyces parvulus]|uniref:STAS domain-containing protein n=1 Tax=Streptomyces parvulus TaxID=146923 RepID=A0ABV5D8Q1_9ACTN